MINRFLKTALAVSLVLASFLFLTPEAQAQLAPEYLRNGECYLMIGEGPLIMRGIYRLNNPEKAKLFNPPIYLFTPNSSFTFAADLNRKIYTFTEQIAAGFTLLSGNIKRQVIDTVAANHADYGYHTWIHYDHRNWGKNTNVYRTGPVGRGIKANSGTWGNFKSAGPGTLIGTPTGNPLPNFTGSLALGIYSGKSWYEIPNGSWYSSWRTGGAVNNGYSTFYVVFGDKEEGKAHDWKLYTWTPNDLNLDSPVYSSSVGSTVATSYDKQIARQMLAGCLDGCGGASGSGSGVADSMINDLAFMPPIKTNPSRTYFYSRPENKPGNEITLNSVLYTPPATNPIIGLPDNTDTLWIGVSMRSVTSDYVYTLGNSVIKDWYNIVTGSPATGMNISAVAVSNQWNQEGGVVYAYDQAGKMIYKFIRKEKDGSPLASDRYQALSMASILSAISATPGSIIDDIKADGFGSLYFALSHPSKNVADYDPRLHFKLDDAMYLHVPDWTGTEDLNAFLIFKQPYSKSVYERNIYDGAVTKIGSKNYAEKYFNIAIKMDKAGLLELQGVGAMPHSQTATLLASWSAQIGNNDGVVDWKDFSNSSLGLFYEYDHGDPGKCRLSVINVPTPPIVHSLGGKKSYLDIVGPYNAIPFYDSTNRNTNQGDGLISPAPSPLSTDHLYFYMVENYPLPDGPQNPNSQPNWDNDGRMGGFITSMVDPKSSKNGGRVFYRWRTWMVEDLYGNPVIKSLNSAAPAYPADSGQDEYYYFYSPVPGKYILTCQVTYDWYDYDLLKFGDTIDDLPSVKRTGEIAVPSAVGAIAADPSSNRLNAIMNTDPFKFMLASSALYINEILEGGNENFALIPLEVGGVASIPTSTWEIARIQRCDEMDKPSLDNNASWYPQGALVNPAGGFHGIQAGRSYNWRMDVASQTNLFFNINGSTNITPGAADYNYVAHNLMDVNSPFYVNTKPEFQFRNLGGDLKWAQPFIRVTAHLQYKVPKDGGGYNVVNYPLIQDPNKPGEPMEIPAIPASFPIITTTGGDLPPTDPYDAELVITMRRMFEYNMWLRIWNGSNWIWGSYLTLPKDLMITAKTTVRIIDLQKPKIVFADTIPNNLFGETGKLLTEGVGPSGMKNPADVKFTILDNNPWEAIDTEMGITDPGIYSANRIHNDSIINPTTGNFLKAKPTAQHNLKPVFAKLLNRGVFMQLETSARVAQGQSMGAYTKTIQPLSDDYKHFFYKNAANAILENASRFQKEAQTYSETLPNGKVDYRAKIQFKLPLNYVRVGGGDSLQIPAGYANNTPGYGDKAVDANLIKPYLFYLGATDSSGNALPATKLNLALHVRDVIAPFPYGESEEMKDGRISRFPAADNLSDDNNYEKDLRSLYSHNENLLMSALVDSDNWSADKDGKIDKTPFRALKSMGAALVAPFSDSEYMAQIENSIPPGYGEDNVTVKFRAGVTDNAGVASSTFSIKFFDTTSTQQTRTMAKNPLWSSTSIVGTEAVSLNSETAVVFRGKPEQFPMAAPIEISAKDNARNWDYYNGGAQADVNNPWSEWVWGSVNWGNATPNERTFNTSFPVFGSKLIIRTIDKGIRNN